MNIVFKYIKTVLIATGLLIFTGCNDNLVDTEQFQGDIHLNVFGPCPVARGGELQFIGSGLDKINSIEIPNCTPITDIQRISEKEIRIVVPQTAEVGYVTLNYSGGQIKTKTPITYSEPVSIESISPNQVRPGEKIEIKGDYLNLMSQVCFNFIEGGDSVNVRHDEFLTHDRKTITVIVPEEAVSGFITLTDASAVQQRIKSPNELTVTLPSVDKVLELNDVTPGTNLTIKGRDLDLVKRVVMPNDNNVDFSYDASGSSISFSLPSDISEGTIYVVPASGVKVEVAKVTVAMPSDLTISPEKDVKANDVITISGKYVNQIVSVTIPNVDTPVDVNIVSDSEINFIFPAMGQSGKIGLNLPSGKIIESRLTTAKPEAYSFNPMSVATGGEFTIIGKNLDLVNTLTFINDITITVEAESSTSLTVVVPAQAQSGPLTLTMANGESVRTLPLTVKSLNVAISAVLSQRLSLQAN